MTSADQHSTQTHRVHHHQVDRPSYDAFMAALEEAVGKAKAADQSVSLALYDLDSFAKVNEKYGTEVGDAVLVHVATELTQTLGTLGTVFRYGGDAFCVLFPDTEKEQAFLLSEQGRRHLEREVALGPEGKAVTLKPNISAGVSSYPDDGSEPGELVRKANEALYRAKVTGPGKVCLAREEKMVTKTSHYTQGQLQGLSRLAKRLGIGEAELLREGLDDLLRKYNA